MENAKEFVYRSIQGLVDTFSNLKASIMFEGLSNAYFVQLKPLDDYSQIELKRKRLSILEDFYNYNFDCSLTFINEDSLMEIKDFDIDFIGNKYCDLSQFIIISENHVVNFNNEVEVTDSMITGIISAGENNYALAA